MEHGLINFCGAIASSDSILWEDQLIGHASPLIGSAAPDVMHC